MRNKTNKLILCGLLLLHICVLMTSCMQLPSLHDAVINGDMAKIESYAKRTGYVNAKDRYGNTPLHYAYFCGRKEVIYYLLTAGANSGETNYVGDTPLDMEKLAAAESLVEEALKLLTSEGNWEDATRGQTIYNQLSQIDGSITTRALILKILSSRETVIGEALGWDKVIKERTQTAQTRDLKHQQDDSIVLSPLHTFDVHPMTYYTHDLRFNLNIYDRRTAGACTHLVFPATTSRLQAALLAIKLGIPASEERLDVIIAVADNVDMANAYLNSGSSELEEAARRWVQYANFRGGDLVFVPADLPAAGDCPVIVSEYFLHPLRRAPSERALDVVVDTPPPSLFLFLKDNNDYFFYITGQSLLGGYAWYAIDKRTNTVVSMSQQWPIKGVNRKIAAQWGQF